MQITNDLRLTLPVKDGVSVYHTPISRDVYETCFRLLRETKIAMVGNSVRHAFAGLGDAVLYLRDAARKLAAEGGADESAALSLLSQIKRLTLVLAPSAQGMDTIPVDVAIRGGKLSEDEWADVEAQLVFFTAWVAGTSRLAMAEQAKLGAGMMGGQMTSLQPTEWASSSATSTPAAPSTSPSSVPS